MTDKTETIKPTILTPSGLDWDLLDPDALRAVQRLQERGFEAYLVGGCVRDLLAGAEPKDFDIATSASPQHVRRCFPRNCRVIGRRFKLAHLHYNNNQKILEVSTFRRQPEVDADAQEDGDLLITQDNEFGTAQEDALRRDFTVNALFLDSVKDCIIDYTDGLGDIENKIIRCIGDPLVRFREDPVRILRAAKFCGRLGLHAEPKTLQAMVEVAPDLTRAAPPRLLEEILRLLRGGHSLDSFQMLRDIGAIDVILPIVGKYLNEAEVEERVVFWRILEALDVSQQKLPRGTRDATANGLLLGALYARPVQREAQQADNRSATSIAEELIQPFAEDLRLPRRDTGCVKRICGVQSRFTSKGKQRFKTASFLHDPYFDEALSLFSLTCIATGQNKDDLDHWRNLAYEAEPQTEQDTQEEEAVNGSRKPARTRAPRKKATRSSKATRSTKAPAGSSGKDDSRAEGTRSKRGSRKKPASKKSTRRSSRDKQSKIETIEPEAIDLSAFDVELDSKRVPTFGTIVEGHGKKKRTPKMPDPESDTYKPPPPPGSEGDGPATPPPPPSSDDVFGDW